MNEVDVPGLEVAGKVDIGDFPLVYNVTTYEGKFFANAAGAIGKWGLPGWNAHGRYRDLGLVPRTSIWQQASDRPPPVNSRRAGLPCHNSRMSRRRCTDEEKARLLASTRE